jgi:hypothetical protein
MNAHIEFMKSEAKRFITMLDGLSVQTFGFSVSENLYGVSIYFKGVGANGKEFSFRFSDHDCQRGEGALIKVSHNSYQMWCEKYEQINFPERFDWQYHDKYIQTPYGVKQVKSLIGRKQA